MPFRMRPEANAFLTVCGFALPEEAAAVSRRSAEAGVVPAGKRKIQGILAEVRDLSSLKATTGTKHLSASCSERWLAFSSETDGSRAAAVSVHPAASTRRPEITGARQTAFLWCGLAHSLFMGEALAPSLNGEARIGHTAPRQRL